MVWLAVDKNGSEKIFTDKPSRDKFSLFWDCDWVSGRVPLPKGSIKKLIGRELTWSDEPVEI